MATAETIFDQMPNELVSGSLKRARLAEWAKEYFFPERNRLQKALKSARKAFVSESKDEKGDVTAALTTYEAALNEYLTFIMNVQGFDMAEVARRGELGFFGVLWRSQHRDQAIIGYIGIAYVSAILMLKAGATRLAIGLPLGYFLNEVLHTPTARGISHTLIGIEEQVQQADRAAEMGLDFKTITGTEFLKKNRDGKYEGKKVLDGKFARVSNRILLEKWLRLILSYGTSFEVAQKTHGSLAQHVIEGLGIGDLLLQWGVGDWVVNGMSWSDEILTTNHFVFGNELGINAGHFSGGGGFRAAPGGGFHGAPGGGFRGTPGGGFHGVPGGGFHGAPSSPVNHDLRTNQVNNPGGRGWGNNNGWQHGNQNPNNENRIGGTGNRSQNPGGGGWGNNNGWVHGHGTGSGEGNKTSSGGSQTNNGENLTHGTATSTEAFGSGNATNCPPTPPGCDRHTAVFVNHCHYVQGNNVTMLRGGVMYSHTGWLMCPEGSNVWQESAPPPAVDSMPDTAPNTPVTPDCVPTDHTHTTYIDRIRLDLISKFHVITDHLFGRAAAAPGGWTQAMDAKHIAEAVQSARVGGMNPDLLDGWKNELTNHLAHLQTVALEKFDNLRGLWVSESGGTAIGGGVEWHLSTPVTGFKDVFYALDSHGDTHRVTMIWIWIDSLHKCGNWVQVGDEVVHTDSIPDTTCVPNDTGFQSPASVSGIQSNELQKDLGAQLDHIQYTGTDNVPHSASGHDALVIFRTLDSGNLTWRDLLDHQDSPSNDPEVQAIVAQYKALALAHKVDLTEKIATTLGRYFV